MALINHINFLDENGCIFCRRAGKIMEVNPHFLSHMCNDCPFFNGSAQGEGVECLWEDTRDIPSGFIATNSPSDEIYSIVESGQELKSESEVSEESKKKLKEGFDKRIKEKQDDVEVE